MTRDEAFKLYEEALSKIDKEVQEARDREKAILHGRLAAIRVALHEELKAIRAIEQKTKRRVADGK